MTMSSGEIERKVRQLDNDVQAIYVLLHEISATQSRHGNRLDGIDGRLDGIDGHLDRLVGSMAEVLRRLPEAS